MKYIESNRDTLGGALVVRGTRVPVSRLLYLLCGRESIEIICESYPHITKQQIKGAIDDVVEILQTLEKLK